MRSRESLTAARLTIALAAFLAAPAYAGTARFAINPAETIITASVAEPMEMLRGSAKGTFSTVSGEVEGDPKAIAASGRVKIVVAADSYKSDSDARDTDVKENALEVGTYPTISFEATRVASVQQDSPYSANFQLLGRLTLHGTPREIAVPVSVWIDAQNRLVATGSFAVRFEDYGVKRPSKMMGMMTTGDVATITFHVVADPR